jgi:hypothetical protein
LPNNTPEDTNHILLDTATHVYKCLNCGYESEPPWMTPPADVAQAAISVFISEHRNCMPSEIDRPH